MLKFSFFISIVLFLFLGSNVHFFLGWNSVSDFAPIWQRISLAAYILWGCGIYVFLFTRNKTALIHRNKEESYLLFTFLFLTLYLIVLNHDGFLSLINGLILPILISFLLSELSRKYNYLELCHILRKIIITFLVVNSSIAIIEKMLHINVFPLLRGSGDVLIHFSGEFRSTALQNHPLSNALVTSIIMSFILVSKMKISLKLSLWSLGFIAILCFNTRSSIFGWGIFFSFFLIHQIFLTKKGSIERRLFLLILSFLMIFGVSAIIINLNWGDRLLNMGLFDDQSAEIRVRIWEVFNYYSIGDFLWGMSEKSMKDLAVYIEVGIIENWLLIFIFRFGVVFTTVMVFGYFRLIRKLFMNYEMFQMFFVSMVFLLISLTNNSLASSGNIALALFVLCIFVFKPVIR